MYYHPCGVGPFPNKEAADRWYHNKYHDLDDPNCCRFAQDNQGE